MNLIMRIILPTFLTRFYNTKFPYRSFSSVMYAVNFWGTMQMIMRKSISKYRVIHKSVKHFKNSQQIDYARIAMIRCVVYLLLIFKMFHELMNNLYIWNLSLFPE
jgi:hypothetical protein